MPAVSGDSFRQALGRSVRAFRAERVQYMLIGAWALAVWGRPRATLDLDFLVMLDEADLARLGARMGRQGLVADEQWLEWNPMLRRSQLRFQFQGVAVDVLCPRDGHDRQAFRRRRRRRMGGHYHWFPAPEDLILQKLKVGRPRDFEDAAGVVRRLWPALDAAYLRRWARRLRIAAELEYVFPQ